MECEFYYLVDDKEAVWCQAYGLELVAQQDRSCVILASPEEMETCLGFVPDTVNL